MSLYEVNQDIYGYYDENKYSICSKGDICSINFAKINHETGKIYIFNNTNPRGRDGTPVDSKYFTQHKDDSGNDVEPYFDIIPRQKSEVTINADTKLGGRRTKKRTKKRSRKSRRL